LLINIVFNKEYDLAAWNSVPSADTKELKRVQQKFMALLQKTFLYLWPCHLRKFP